MGKPILVSGTPQYEAFLACALEGATSKELGERFGLKPESARSVIQRAIQRGLLPPLMDRRWGDQSHRRKAGAFQTMLASRYQIKTGAIHDALQMLDTNEIKWLIDQTLPGSSLAETLALIVRDAYAEDMDSTSSL